VWFAAVQSLDDASLIPGAIVEALRLPRLPQVEPLDQAVEVLSRQSSLLVLDNFEHLVEDGTVTVRTLLERAPTVTCLVTSRQTLNLAGETESFVAPLPTPSGEGTPEGLMSCDSVQLFVDRAQAARPDFQVTRANARAVADLCTALEGIPLALELAGARAQVLTPAQMLGQLEHRFEFLVTRRRDVPERHRSLRAAIEWSYHALPPELQRLFRRLSVFRGGWTVEAAEAVCKERQALVYLERLREASLVLLDAGAEEAGEAAGMRFRLLETLREYGREQLATKERASLGARHAAHFLALAEEAASATRTGAWEQWLPRLAQEHDNLRAALAWFKGSPAGVEAGLRLAGALGNFWEDQGHLSEGRAHLSELLSREEAAIAPAARALGLHTAGSLAFGQGDLPEARELLQQALALQRELGDLPGIAASTGRLGLTAFTQGDYQEAQGLYDEALAISRARGNQASEALALVGLAHVAERRGDHESAEALLATSLAIYRQLGSRRGVGASLRELGTVALARGDRARGRSLLEESLAVVRELGLIADVAGTLQPLAMAAWQEGDYVGARSYAAEALRLSRELGQRGTEAYCLGALGMVAGAEGQFGEAEVLHQEAVLIARATGDRYLLAACLQNLAVVAGRRGDRGRARALLEEALAINRETGYRTYEFHNLSNLSALARCEGDLTAARQLLAEALTMQRELGIGDLGAAPLPTAAETLAAERRPTEATTLSGAADAVREAAGTPLRPAEREEVAMHLSELRTALGDGQFEAAWAEGRRMTWEQAVAYALEQLGAPA
jgi:predicted ATPase